MKKATAVLGSGLVAIAMVGALAGTAISGVNGAGIDFKAASPGDAACIQTYSWNAITNTCSTARLVLAMLPTLSEGWRPTSVSVHGSNSWCQSVVTNDVGNAAQSGTATWTTAGPPAWQLLNTGDRYVWAWSSLLFRCMLEPGGRIGAFKGQ